ncbi:hypothetical protein ACJJTC_003952 [Scirpophaga incertulas]
MFRDGSGLFTELQIDSVWGWASPPLRLQLGNARGHKRMGEGGSPGGVVGGVGGGGARLAHTSEKHPRAILGELSALRRHRELCDVVLNVANRKLFAHRVILSACSPYFRAMFTGELAESRATEVTIRDVDELAMEQLVDFCYTAHIVVEESNVQIGHIEAVCFVKKNSEASKNSNCNTIYEDINSVRIQPFIIKLQINGTILDMEVDSGCAFSLISEATARTIWNGRLPYLQEIEVGLKTWTENKLELLGQIDVGVKWKGSNKKLPLYIARGKGPSLIGRNWFHELNISLQGVYNLKSDTLDTNEIAKILKTFKEVFQSGLGKYTGPVVRIHTKQGVTPRFLKIQTIKNKLKKHSSLPLHIKLPMILYNLRTTPNSLNEKTPAELLNNRRFRTKFDRLNPLSCNEDEQAEIRRKNEKVKLRMLTMGQSVYVRNFAVGPKWMKGVVEKRIGLCKYVIKCNDKIVLRHINQIQTFGDSVENSQERVNGNKNNSEVVSIPSPSKWASIIGVSGPQDVEIHDSPQASRGNSKRGRSFSPSSPISKRMAYDLQDNSSESDTYESDH